MLSERMLSPARRWALRELKVHPGQTVIAAGHAPAWVLDDLGELVGERGTVIAIDRRDAIPDAADRLLLDDRGLLADAEVIDALFASLGPAARVAAICRRSGGQPSLERWLPEVRRESFYFGAAYVLWGQLP